MELADQAELVGGGATAAAGAYGLTNVLREYTRNIGQLNDHAKGIGDASKYKPRVGDIILQNVNEDLDKFKAEWLSGNPVSTHGAAILPGIEGSGPRIRTYGSGSARIPQHLSPLATFFSEMKKDTIDKLLHPIRTFKDMREIRKRMADRAGKFTREGKIKSILGESDTTKHGVIADFIGDDRSVRILRPKQRLSSADRIRMLKNELGTAYMRADKDDILAQGVNDLLGIKGDGKPAVCVGGVCSTFDGVRNLPSASQATGATIANSPDFETILASKINPERLNKLKWGARARLGVRGAIPGAMIAGGSFLASPLFDYMAKESMDKESVNLSQFVRQLGKHMPTSDDAVNAFKSHKVPLTVAGGVGTGVGLLGGYASGEDGAMLTESVSDGLGATLGVGSLALGQATGKRKFNELMENITKKREAYLGKKFGLNSPAVEALQELGYSSFDDAQKWVDATKNKFKGVDLSTLDQAGLDELISSGDAVDEVKQWFDYRDKVTANYNDRMKYLGTKRYNRLRGPIGLLAGLGLAAGVGTSANSLSEYAMS